MKDMTSYMAEMRKKDVGFVGPKNFSLPVDKNEAGYDIANPDGYPAFTINKKVIGIVKESNGGFEVWGSSMSCARSGSFCRLGHEFVKKEDIYEFFFGMRDY